MGGNGRWRAAATALRLPYPTARLRSVVAGLAKVTAGIDVLEIVSHRVRDIAADGSFSRQFHLIVSITEFVAAGRHTSIADFVHGRLERHTVEISDDMAIADFVARFRIEYEITHRGRIWCFPVNGSYQALTIDAEDDFKPVAGDHVVHVNSLADNQLL